MITPFYTQLSFIRSSGGYDQIVRNGRLENPGEVRQIRGFSVDVSGIAARMVRGDAQPPPIPARFPPAGNPLASDTLAHLQKSAPLDTRSGGFDLRSSSALTTADLPAGELEACFSPDFEAAGGMGYLPGSVMGTSGELDYFRRELASSCELAKIEKELQKEFGTPVKVVFDQLAEEYLMITPDQEGYDRVRSAGQVLAMDISMLQNSGYPRSAFRDVLAQYDIKI